METAPILHSERMAGAMAGLLAATRADPSKPASGPRTSLGAVLEHLSDSLYTHRRLVVADVHARAGAHATATGRGLAVVARAVPLAIWMRGPDDRIVGAALRLSTAVEDDGFNALAAAMLCIWLRRMYQRRTPERAWSGAIAALDSATAALGTDPTLWTAMRSMLTSPAAAFAHPAPRALWQVRNALASAQDPTALLAELRRSGACEAVLAVAASAAGVHFGAQAICSAYGPAWMHAPQVRTAREWAAQRYRLDYWPPETSQTHPLAVAEVQLGTAKLGLCPCPGQRGFDTPHAPIDRDLEIDVARLAQWGARHVVCLLGADILLDCGIEQYQPVLAQHGIRFWHLPWYADPSDPWFRNEHARILRRAAAALQAGEPVIVHSLEFEATATAFAAELLAIAQPDRDSGQAAQHVALAVHLAQLDAQRHDRDE